MVSVVESTKPTPADETGNAWFSRAWLEPRFVVVTLIAWLGGIMLTSATADPMLIVVVAVIAYITGGVFGVIKTIDSLRQRRIDVDLLMILAALGAAIVGQWLDGVLLLFLFSLSNVLQDYAIGRSRRAIKGLLKLYPSEATVKRGGTTEVIAIDAIRAGDMILIAPGERIPVDGIVHAGASTLDESAITGESMPVEKAVGDRVFAGTLNYRGVLDVEASGAARETMLARIITLVEQAQDSKAPTERFLERFEQVYAAVILVAVGLFIVLPPTLAGIDFSANFYRAMVLMTVAAPCALVISTPAAFISAIAAAARSGILFKGGAYIELLARVKAIAFDKTGTLTQGNPAVTAVVPAEGSGVITLLHTAASVEARSEHPLAGAIVAHAHAQGIALDTIDSFEALPGRGIDARLGGSRVRIGSVDHLTALVPPPTSLAAQALELEHGGQTVIGVLLDDQWLGVIALADQVRPEARSVVADLRARGIVVAMLTGDNPRVAKSIADKVGVEHVYAGLLPEDKVRVIHELEATFGETAMVGDGVNDAPALATASIGIAMGAGGTDVALETADIVLTGDRLVLIPEAIRLTRKARRVVWQNISFSLAVIVLLLIGAFAIDLPLPLGVLGHEGSTVIVVLNGVISLLAIEELRRRRLARASAESQGKIAPSAAAGTP